MSGLTEKKLRIDFDANTSKCTLDVKALQNLEKPSTTHLIRKVPAGGGLRNY